jgi:hypothetical protein
LITIPAHAMYSPPVNNLVATLIERFRNFED